MRRKNCTARSICWSSCFFSHAETRSIPTHTAVPDVCAIELNSENSRRRRCGSSQRRGQAGCARRGLGVWRWRNARTSGGGLPALPVWCSAKCVRACVPHRDGDGVHFQPSRSPGRDWRRPRAYTPGSWGRPAVAYHADMSDCTRFVPTDQLPFCLVISLRVPLGVA